MKINKKLKIVFIVILSIFMILSLTIIVTTGVIIPSEYDEPLESDYYSEFEDVRKQIISFGISAPNSHNMQPWRIVLDDSNSDQLLLYIDETRTLPVTDANYDQMVFSCGTFLAYLTEGASILGYSLDIEKFPVSELPSEPTIEELRNTPIAKVTIVQGNTDRVTSLDAIAGPTKRLPFDDSEISQSELDRLLGLQTEFSIDFDIINEEPILQEIKDLLIEGVLIESSNQLAMEESSAVFRYTTYQKNQTPYGLTLHSDNPSRVTRIISEFLGKLFPLGWEEEGEFWYERDSVNVQKTNYFGVLRAENTRLNQLEAGILYGRISLLSRELNLELQPLSQIIQVYPEMNDLRLEAQTLLAEDNQTVQLIFRIGETSLTVSDGIRFQVDDIIE